MVANFNLPDVVADVTPVAVPPFTSNVTVLYVIAGTSARANGLEYIRIERILPSSEGSFQLLLPMKLSVKVKFGNGIHVAAIVHVKLFE